MKKMFGIIAKIKEIIGIPKIVIDDGDKIFNFVSNSKTVATYENKNPATIDIQAASRFFDINKIARNAIIPPIDNLITNNKISGVIFLPNLIFGF